MFAKIKKKSNNVSMQTQIDLNQNMQISKDVIARKNQDGTVIVMRLDESSIFYKIDGIAAQVWGSLSQSKNMAQLITEFEQLYPENKTDLQKDIPPFLGDLLQKKLLIEC